MIPTPAIAPSILSSDFARLGEQIETVMDAGARVIHVDVMDGHFVPPITIGPLIVEAIRELVKGRGGTLDVHLMIERPERQVEAFAKAGADVITIHPEATPNIHYGQLVPDDVVLEVDGGISLETIDEAREAGAQLFVAGSSVFGAPDPAEAFRELTARLR